MALSRIKWLKLGLFRTKPSRQHYLILIIVFKLLDSQTIVICLKLSAKLLFSRFFLAVLALSWIKLFQLSLFCTKHGTQHYLVYIIVLKWLDSKTIFMYLKLRAKLRFKFFYIVLALSRIKWFKHGFFRTKHSTLHYLV